MNALLNEPQRDALQELMNISMGQAANALARLIDTKITLSIPLIVSATPTEFIALLQTSEDNWFSRQSFLGQISGEVLTLLNKEGCGVIARSMDYDLPLTETSSRELVLELANILAGACLNGFSEQLSLTTRLNMPTLYFPVSDSIEPFRWGSTLLMEVEFRIDASQFDSKVVICLDEKSVDALLVNLNLLLE